MKTKSQAQAASSVALGKIKLEHQKHWQICTHENMGWHWCLESIGGLFTLHQSERDGKYWCLLSGTEHKHCGCMDWQTDRSFKDPNQAIRFTVLLAEKYQNEVKARITLAKTVLLPAVTFSPKETKPADLRHSRYFGR